MVDNNADIGDLAPEVTINLVTDGNIDSSQINVPRVDNPEVDDEQMVVNSVDISDDSTPVDDGQIHD
ncbi:hypothetical protein A2U01_0118376, partial [Trifolium medium]|nr:hypothetical protein [Trifolium medium]